MLSKQINIVLKKIADKILLDAKKNLHKPGSALEKSLNVKINNFSIMFYAADYAVFIDKGRKKNSRMPPLQAIVKWTQLKDIPIIAAFPIAKSISKNGIKAIKFLPKTDNNKINLKSELKRIILEEISDLIKSTKK